MSTSDVNATSLPSDHPAIMFFCPFDQTFVQDGVGVTPCFVLDLFIRRQGTFHVPCALFVPARITALLNGATHNSDHFHSVFCHFPHGNLSCLSNLSLDRKFPKPRTTCGHEVSPLTRRSIPSRHHLLFLSAKRGEVEITSSNPMYCTCSCVCTHNYGMCWPRWGRATDHGGRQR